MVDEDLRSIIVNLQSKQIKTIALTQFWVGPLGNITSVEVWRLGELNHLGINFESSFKILGRLKLKQLAQLGRR